jgi:hypothetical protein
MSSTAIPARANAARIGKDGNSGKVETTIPHPESNSKKPASFILILPERLPDKLLGGERMHSQGKRQFPRSPPLRTASQSSES